MTGQLIHKASLSSQISSSISRAALDYVTAAFSSRQSQVRVLTTHGSLLSSLSFRAELTGKVCECMGVGEGCIRKSSFLWHIQCSCVCW